MKRFRTFRNLLFILLGTLLVSAYGITAAKLVQALAATNATAEGYTPLLLWTETTQVNTAALIPTLTNTPSPMPTKTAIPASATPSRMEFPVQDASLEIQVIGIKRPYHVYLGDDLIYDPGEGNMFLELGINVINFTDSDIPLKWSDVYLINKYQDKWYPVWGAYEKTNLVIDPFTVAIPRLVVDPKTRPDARIYLGDNGYLRAIFRLPRDNYYYYFSFADLPLIEINTEDQ